MLGEHALLERLRRLVRNPPPWVPVGIGDDAAILEPDRGALMAVSTDALIEDVHFRRSWTPPGSIGHKALAVALSDLAAMGAAPRASLLSLALPAGFPDTEFDELLEGFAALASTTGAALVGGNLARSPGPLVVDVTVIGAVKRRRWLQRTGGRAGDELYVTGDLGGAAAGLAMFHASADPSQLDESERDCLTRYERPEARLAMGLAIGRNRAAVAAIDLSDGLADGARQLAHAGGTGVVIEADAIPIHAGSRRWAARSSGDALSLALSGGEDYELLFLVRPRQRRAFLAAAQKGGRLPVTRVGRLIREPGEWLERNGRRDPLPPGFAH
ncbi:MAG TPA: thiamine-phosphate kinase [Vicinamibacterales bacterium]|nr:thiamine-phosphate kinase [Vicinamibacterales bacterium]